MYAVTGITGQVGRATARALQRQGAPIRAVVRDEAKGHAWARAGAEVVVADFRDAAALQRAFTGTQGVFVMIPPNFTPAQGFPETRAIVAALHAALAAARPPKIVCLSTVGAQHARGIGILEQLHILEQTLTTLPVPHAFLRAAWFMENATWDLEGARKSGEFPSFLQPLDRAIPMVATADVGAVAAGTLLQAWSGRRVINVEGPRPYSPNDVAQVFSGVLGRPVRAVAVPRATWAALFAAQGATPSEGRIEMLDAFNSGWAAFDDHGAEHACGQLSLEAVLNAFLGTPAQP